MTADAQLYRPKSERLPKGVFRPTLPKRAVLMVVAVDGVPEWLMMAEGGDDKSVADFKKLKPSYDEMVGEDQGHYVAGTAHIVEVQEDGVVAVGNGVLAFESGVRQLSRVPTPDEDEPAATPAKKRAASRKRKPAGTTAKTTTTRRKAATTSRSKPATRKAKPKATTTKTRGKRTSASKRRTVSRRK